MVRVGSCFRGISWSAQANGAESGPFVHEYVRLWRNSYPELVVRDLNCSYYENR